MKTVVFDPTIEGWQRVAREALQQEVSPKAIFWQEANDEQTAFTLGDEPADLNPQLRNVSATAVEIRVPKMFLELAQLVSLHSDKGKWDLLYRILWRLTHGEPKLLENSIDADFIALTHLEKEVSKDAYRMRAFLRFREIQFEGEPWFVAWYEPEHNTVHLNEAFFTDRFANMRWSILTPKRCMHWDGESVSFSPGVNKSVAPKNDDVEPLWISYYSNIFNPARLKPRAMQAQLLKRNWKNLPEAVVIEPLMRAASRRTTTMIEQSDFQRISDSDFSFPNIPAHRDLDSLRNAAASCRACPLWRNASCTVFGEGAANTKIVFVGEQPGDQEDRAGKPFVGPAGQLLDRALQEAQVNRAETYVTNAVKHFKWEPRGKRRIHKTANAREIAACRPWLEAELDLVKPKLIVSMGATAARSIFQEPIRVTQERGKFLDSQFGKVLVTVHPSSLLRLTDASQQPKEFEKFVSDLRLVNAFSGQ